MSTQLITPALAFHGLPLDKRIGVRRELVKDPKNYMLLGKMIKLLFDPFGMNRPDSRTLDHPVINPTRLDWQKDVGAECLVDYPRLAISRDEQDLLILGALPPLAEVTGPDFDDVSTWVKTTLPGWQEDRGGKRTAGTMPRRYVQRYSDLTVDWIGRGSEPDFKDPDCFFVIQPVTQILIHPAGSDQPAMVEPKANADGTRMAFLVNPRTNEGHFIGGTLHVSTRIHTIPAGTRP